MKRWNTSRIDQLGRVITGKTPSSQRLDEFGSDYPFITPSDIPKTQKRVRTERFLSEKGMEAHKRLRLPRKTTSVVCIGATIGKVSQIERPSISNQQINSIIPAQGEQDADFIYYLATTLKDSLVSFAGGSATPIINKSTFSGIKLLVPEFVEQQKIAAILTAYDDLIEANQRRIALLERMAEEIYREWFVRLRFPGHEKTKLIRGVPTGWKVQALRNVVSEMKRGIRQSELTADQKYIGLEHIPRRSISLREWATADSVKSNKLRFQERDILFSKIRPYLHKVALAHFEGVCSTDAIVLRPVERVYEGYVLFTVFSDTFIELATVASNGTKMPRADWKFRQKLELAIPSRELCAQFQTHFEGHYSQIVALLRANELLTRTRDLLLPRLISGKLSVEDLAIQFPPSMAAEVASGDRNANAHR